MFSDLIGRPLNADAYEDRPFTFLDQPAHNDLANIAAIGLIENGDRAARENWQNGQLVHLLKHAQAKSKFWRQRIPSRITGRGTLKFLPVQGRNDIVTQVAAEGSLAPQPAGGQGSGYASTGSTGTPVTIHVIPQNAYYNSVRALAQYFFYDLGFEPTHVKISPGTRRDKLERKSINVQSSDSWAGPLAKIFRNGKSKHINYYHDEAGLIAELKKDPVGYLVSPSRYVEILMNNGGLDLIRSLGVKLWLHVSDSRDPEIVTALQGIGVPSLSNYSAAEVGPIAFECAKCPGYFHVAHSNVIVECDELTTVEFDGVKVGRILVTHLHSYATPIIRYDVGDFGRLDQTCRCGHDGPAISAIYGRGKHFLRHPDGRLLPFYVSTRALTHAASFKECRVMQPQLGTIVVEIGGRETLTSEETARLKMLIVNATDPAFDVEIRPVAEIDWGANPKRLFFSSAVA